MPNSVTTSQWESEVLASEQPVLVDFWADWCGPCHMVEPVVEQIADERSEGEEVGVLEAEDVAGLVVALLQAPQQRRHGAVEEHEPQQ
jgi:thiol-disulfide isomerase/thioredoxin